MSHDEGLYSPPERKVYCEEIGCPHYTGDDPCEIGKYEKDCVAEDVSEGEWWKDMEEE